MNGHRYSTRRDFFEPAVIGLSVGASAFFGLLLVLLLAGKLHRQPPTAAQSLALVCYATTTTAESAPYRRTGVETQPALLCSGQVK